MFSACPKCQTRLSVEMKHFDEETAVVCAGCRSILKMKLVVEIIAESNKASSSPAAASTPSEEIPRQGTSGAKKVLVCIDGEGTRDLIKEILTEARFKVIDVPSGKEFLLLIQQHRPAAVLIDVGLSDMLGTELCAAIKKDPQASGTVIILVASIYDKNTKYRRQPDSLFGADDYIERHHIQKDLLIKIKKHLNEKEEKKETSQPVFQPEVSSPALKERSSPSSSWGQISAPGQPSSPAPRPAPAPAGTAAPAQESSKEHQDAKRLARIIVSDIVLYNKKKVDEGIRTDTFFDLLKEEIEEGRKHYVSRVSPEIQKAKDYYKEAFDEFISKRKAVTSR